MAVFAGVNYSVGVIHIFYPTVRHKELVNGDHALL